jgi:predicted dehydrogenase/threonine dehydrogenase-like Zn-dependent dehydrogenase
MKQVIVSEGQVSLHDVPAPMVQPGTVVVQVDHSCVSVGTEMSGVLSTGRSLAQRVMQQPQHVLKVVDLVRSEGVASVVRLVRDRLSVELPTGYSCAGRVVEVGEGVTEYKIGDRVACAGAQYAYHAEFVCIPTNLAILIPEGVGFAEASTVALGAIALQGIRRAAPTLGEIFVVVGLGFLGQLTVQMLKVNGCRVIGVDVDRDRIAAARTHGLDWGLHPDDVAEVDAVVRLTGGNGADAVIITAASQSDEIVSAAFRMSRKKARVVLVGDVGLDLRRADFYAKELDFLISASYGPGRYDENYEEGGLDYPIGYVRWTEGRNMAEYLRLIADGLVDLSRLARRTYPLAEAAEAYSSLKTAADKPLLVLLSYAGEAVSAPARRVKFALGGARAAAAVERIRIGVIGAGGFAKGMHLPNLAEMPDLYELRAVASRTGHNAAATAKRFGASYCTTDHTELLRDPAIDAVIIATRHDTHARLALEALRAGKHVLLEKPLALSVDEVDAIEAFYGEGGIDKPLLLTGFNRRFSPLIQKIAEGVAGRSNPMIVNYRMNAGYIPLDHWVHGAEGGGRNLGEACHIYDLFTFLTQSEVVSVEAQGITPQTDFYSKTDNFVATIRFKDGSIGTLTYTALGSTDFAKEAMEVYVDGSIYSLDDYRSLNVVGPRKEIVELRKADKGQKNQLSAFAQAIKTGETWPVPLWQQAQATRISFRVETQVRG